MKLIESRLGDWTFIESLLDQYKVPGISYCFIINGQAKKAEAIGIKNKETKTEPLVKEAKM